ncbi:MAG: DEAD/DEAH box helicase [Chloroflexi bacterium]|nr:DEAD/DEAH box helicase [Chloroflexota bacterium]
MLLGKVASVLGQFLKFVQEGNEIELKLAYATLSLCQKTASQMNDWYWWWWMECIRLVITEFNKNCLWTQLNLMMQEINASEMVSTYIKANYKRNNPVVELWRTQIESLDAINDPKRRSFCLSIPTSGGKTRVAELAILRFLLDHADDLNAKCVYIAPLRKLAHEVEQTLLPIFSKVTSNPIAVSSFYGGQELDIVDKERLTESRILIVTPEKLDGMLRYNPDMHSQIRLVIADEGHMIGDESSRGYKYRMLLERLIYLLRIKPIASDLNRSRLLLVSGVLPNANEFAGLIAGDASSLVHINWCPSDEPLIAQWTWNGQNLVTSNNLCAHLLYFNPSMSEYLQ